MTVDESNSVIDTATAIRLQCDTLKAILQQLSTSDTTLDVDQRTGIATAGTVALLKIKGAHRDAYEAAEAARAATASAKNALESGALQLANLEYQRSHHEADIAACLDDRSAFSAADVALLPEEEFHLQTGGQWEGEMDTARRHDFNIARLKNEHTARQALQSSLHKAKARKAEVAAVVAQKRRFLESLSFQVDRIREAGGPLRTLLSFAPLGAQLPPRCQELPLPLYVMASHVAALESKAPAAISVSIIDSAVPSAEHPASDPCADVDMTDMIDSAGREEEEEEGALPDVPPDADVATNVDVADVADVASGAVSSESERSEAGDPRGEATTAGSDDAVHPLAVRIAIGPADASQLLVIFTYSPKRHVILTAGGNPESAAVLACLSAAEESSKSRHGSKKPPVTNPSLSVTAAAGPQLYRWAQQLGAIDFLAAPSPDGDCITVEAADGNALACLSEYRSSGRALKSIEQLTAAKETIANVKS